MLFFAIVVVVVVADWRFIKTQIYHYICIHIYFNLNIYIYCSLCFHAAFAAGRFTFSFLSSKFISFFSHTHICTQNTHTEYTNKARESKNGCNLQSPLLMLHCLLLLL